MSDHDNAKPAKNVMGNLPSTRPTRIGRRRDGEPVTRQAEAAPAERQKAKAKSSSKAARKPPAAGATPTRATPKAAGRPAKQATPRARAGQAAAKPRAVRSGSPSLDAAKKARALRRQPAPEPPKGAELVTTAVQATGELAKIGLTLGGQALKRAARRLPKR